MPNELLRHMTCVVVRQSSAFLPSLLVALLIAGSVKAAPLSEKALRSRDPDLRTRFRQAVEFFAAEDYVAAETLFVELAGRTGLVERDQEICLFMVGRCRFSRADYVSCRRHYADYLDRFPESEYASAAWVLIGHSRFYSGDNLGAARAYAEALTRGLDKHRQIALDNLEPLVRRGLSLSGLESLSDVLGNDGWCAQARFWIAERLAQSRRRGEALREFRHVARDAGRTDLGKRALGRIADLERSPAIPVTVGLLLPLTGEYHDFGRRAQAAAELAAETVSDSLRLAIADAGTDPLQTARAADSLVNEGCVAVIGPLLSEGIAASAGVLRANEVVQILPVVRRGADDLALFSPWIVQLSVPAARQARQLALAAGAGRGLRRLAALAANTPQSRAAVESFREAGAEAGTLSCVLEYFRPGEVDYRVSVRRLAQNVLRRSVSASADSGAVAGQDSTLPVDALLIWGVEPEDLAHIAPLARDVGFGCPLLGDRSWEEYRTVDPTRSLLDSVLYVSDQVMDTTGPEWPGFARRYRELSGTEPDWLAARIFDAVNFVMAAARSGGHEPLIDRLLLPGTLTGVTGGYHLGADRVASRAGLFLWTQGQHHPWAADRALFPSAPARQR